MSKPLLPTELDQVIEKTVAWFALFELPATVFEIVRWQAGARADAAEIRGRLLASPWLQSRLQEQDGFFTLAGMNLESMIAQRHHRFLDADRKFKKLRRAARVFGWLPGVRAIAAGNTLAWWNTKPESDIDLFVIVEPGKLWSTRFCMVLPFLLLGARPHAQEFGQVDPFCFSFFTDASSLAFEGLKIGQEDPYLASWIVSLVPILDKDGALEAFSRQNLWTKDVFPNAEASVPHPYLRVRPRVEWSMQPGFLERFFKQVQMRRFPPSIRALMNQDTRVIVNDQMLKFHDTDRRMEYLERWHQLIDAYAN